MRIGLNLLHAMPEIGGGWNYIRDLVRYLLNTKSDNHYVVFVTDRSLPILQGSASNVTIVKVNLNSNHRMSRLIYENTLFQIILPKYNLDCVHWFCNYHSVVNFTPSVVTIYDLQPFIEINKHSFIKRNILRLMLINTINKADCLLPMSQSTKSDLHNILHAKTNKMVVIPPILNTAFNLANITPDTVAAFRSKYNLPENYWLYVAHYYPHKDHITLLQAYHKLLTTPDFLPWPLVLRGDGLNDATAIADSIQKLKLNNHVILLPRLDEKEMTSLYAAAGAMVFPSLYEGGGIPILEAMACGCPILSSNLPSIREYAGDSILYFNAGDIGEISASMQSLQDDGMLRNALSRKGLAQSANYAPDLVISKLLTAYKSVQA